MGTLQLGPTVTPQGVLTSAEVVIENGRIAQIRPGSGSHEYGELWAVPGFVDTHCHGGAGHDFASPDQAGVQQAIEFHRQNGSTTLIASTVTESIPTLVEQIIRLKTLVEAEDLAGIHLEGPFLAEARKGAHNAELLCDPDPEIVARLLEAGDGSIAMVTMAPERNHAIGAIKQFTMAGTRVAFGHSDADAVLTRAAVDAGADIATHLFNAMAPVHHRDPGPVPELLHDNRVMVELICDGVHLHPDVVAMSIAAAGAGRVALVTDAMSATGQPDGDCMLGTLAVRVRSGVARLVTPDGCPGAIAGSTLTMAGAFQFVVEQVGCSIAEAARMAATTPARWHRFNEVGSIEIGKYADLCLVDDRGVLHGVMRRGQWIKEV